VTDGKGARTPAWAFALLLGVYTLAGPGLALAVTGRLVYRATTVTHEAEATITSVREQRTRRMAISYCPTIRWLHEGRAMQSEPTYCGDEGEFTVGQRVPVRFEPGDPSTAYIDTFWPALGGELMAYPFALLGCVAFASGVRRWRRLRAEDRGA
jgi:hypothetical protein